MRKEFVTAVSDLLDRNDKAVLLLCDIGVHGFRDAFKKYPDRVYNVGVLEQATVSMAAGLSLAGMYPIVHTIAPFLVERAYEQLKIDFGYQNLPGLFVSVGASYDYSSLGCTHHCPADVSLIENIPNFHIYVPGHAAEVGPAVEAASNSLLNPAYLRLTEKTNVHPYMVGHASIVRDKGGPVIVATGPTLSLIERATYDLPVTVIYYNQVRPFDVFPIIKCGAHQKVIVVEPYYSSHLSSKISTDLCPHGQAVWNFAVPRRFMEGYGTPEDIENLVCFTSDKLRELVKLCLTPP